MSRRRTKVASRGEGATLHYHLCPRCGRAVPAVSGERFCLNDGCELLASCPACGAAITSPHGRYCGRCGAAFGPPREMPEETRRSEP